MARNKHAEQVQVEGSVVRHITVREWQPHASETLPQIHREIDSWGGGTPDPLRERTLDPAYVESKVDRLTKRVKGSHQVIVHETVTEWVEGPPGSGPIAVEEETVQAIDEGGDEGWEPDEENLPSAQVGRLRHVNAEKRPRRRFSLFGRKKKAEEEKRVPVATADADYQPQCSALTDDGAQCRNSARHGSRYCSSHKGYQPPTAKGLAQRIEGDAWDPDDDLTDRQSVATADTRPRVRKAKDTKVKVRKVAKRGGKRRAR